MTVDEMNQVVVVNRGGHVVSSFPFDKWGGKRGALEAALARRDIPFPISSDGAVGWCISGGAGGVSDVNEGVSAEVHYGGGGPGMYGVQLDDSTFTAIVGKYSPTYNDPQHDAPLSPADAMRCPEVAELVEALTKIANAPSEMTWGEDSEVRHVLNSIESIADAALAPFTTPRGSP